MKKNESIEMNIPGWHAFEFVRMGVWAGTVTNNKQFLNLWEKYKNQAVNVDKKTKMVNMKISKHDLNLFKEASEICINNAHFQKQQLDKLRNDHPNKNIPDPKYDDGYLFPQIDFYIKINDLIKHFFAGNFKDVDIVSDKIEW